MSNIKVWLGMKTTQGAIMNVIALGMALAPVQPAVRTFLLALSGLLFTASVVYLGSNVRE